MNDEFDNIEELSMKQLQCHLLLNEIICTTPSSDRPFLQSTTPFKNKIDLKSAMSKRGGLKDDRVLN